MFNKYYENELHKLREKATEFAKSHPVTAPLLMGPSMDPGAERMLEGVAFLSGLLHQKLDNEFQKFIGETLEILYPHLIRHTPSSSIILFEPKIGQYNPVIVNAGTSVASNKIDGTACQFQTIFDIEVNPVQIIATKFNQISENVTHLELHFELLGTNLSRWQPQNGLYFFLGGTYTQSTHLFMLLRNYLRNIILKAENGNSHTLKASSLNPIGFNLDNKTLDFSVKSFAVFNLLQEYFLFPQKFFFMMIDGINKWENRGDGHKFSICFELYDMPNEVPLVNKDSFIFNCAPVTNLFNHEMEPININHKTEKILLQPNSIHPTHYQVYNVESVISYQPMAKEKKEYLPITSFERYKTGQPIYQIMREKSVVNNKSEAFLFLPYQENLANLAEETLAVTVKCSNGNLPEKLQLGDICKPTFDSPEALNFRNILQPTRPIEPALDTTFMWQFMSFLSLNFRSLAEINNFKTLIKLFISANEFDKPKLIANQKRIDGITAINTSELSHLYRGRIMSGLKVELEVSADQFAGLGDVYLFGTIIDSFFTSYISINTCIQFNLKEINTGVIFKWPVKIGNRTLI